VQAANSLAVAGQYTVWFGESPEEKVKDRRIGEITMKSGALVSPDAPAVSYQVGPILIDTASRQIRRNGDIVAVPSKAFDILVYLAARPDSTVPKDELINAVWKDMFVSEDSLVHSMSVLRRALGDDSTHPQLLVTVPRRGYRLRGPVRTVLESVSDLSPNAVEPAAVERQAEHHIEPPLQRTPTRWPNLWMLFPIALVLFLIVREFTAPPPIPRGGTLLFTQSAPGGSPLASGGILSPDSRYLTFVARDQDATQARLYLKQMESAELRPIAGTEGASDPFWAPTSDMIGFFANGVLKTVDLRGDVPKTVASVPVSSGGGSWSGTGAILFSDWQTGLYRVDSAGGRATAVSTVNRAAGELVQKLPQFLPDGRHFLFFLRSGNDDRTGTYVGSLDSSNRVRIPTQSHSPVIYSPPGYLLYVQDDILMAQRFDAARLQVTGEPMVVARSVSAPGDADGKMISASASLLTFRAGAKTQELAWFERNGQREPSISVLKALRSPMFSPDQKQLVAMDSGPRMWMVDLERNAATRLEGEGTYPLWSPDGTRIAFQSHNHLTVYLRNIGGPARDEVLVNDTERKILNDWSPAGDYLVYTTLNPSTKLDLSLLPMSGDKKPIPLLRSPFNESQGRIAPNGRWIAYVSDESGTDEVYVQRFPSLGNKRIVSIGGGVEPMWRRDGKELFYLSPDHSIVSVSFQPTGLPQIGRPKPLFRAPINTSTTRNHYAVTPDGKRFLINVEDQNSFLSPITVMVNWIDALETK
jgi:DNA-binding winged helix-turn-helix (wHTH) protein/Tol biopolymer transport system component